MGKFALSNPLMANSLAPDMYHILIDQKVSPMCHYILHNVLTVPELIKDNEK